MGNVTDLPSLSASWSACPTNSPACSARRIQGRAACGSPPAGNGRFTAATKGEPFSASTSISTVSLATAKDALDAAKAAVASAQADLDNAATADTAADNALGAGLQALGRGAFPLTEAGQVALNPDGTLSVYLPAPGASPPFVVQVLVPSSTVVS